MRTVLVEVPGLARHGSGGRETAIASVGIRAGVLGAREQSKVDEIDRRFHLRG
jgi:hypothetical protein